MVDPAEGNDANVAEAGANELQTHIASTYVNLRLGIGVIGAALPLLLWLGGAVGDGEPLRASMSAYYYSSMRDVFVGALIAVGVALYLYKGFSDRENWALNLAGACALGVALIPTTPEGTKGSGFSWHGASAVLLFLFIAYVSIFRSADTLSLIRDPQKAKKLRSVYRALGVGMVLSPVIAAALTFLLRPTSLTFFIEAVGVLMFAGYWLVKTQELRTTGAERLALAAKLVEAPARDPAVADVPGRLVQVEP